MNSKTTENGGMKKLTQEIFKYAPDWVQSAAVDSDGYVYWFNSYACQLEQASTEHYINAYDYDIGDGETGRKYECAGSGYDTTDWKDSAIDREFGE